MARKKVKAKDLAPAIGVTESRLSQIFKDGNWDNLKQLRAVADYLGQTVEFLLHGKEEAESETPPSVSEEDAATYLGGKTIRPITVTVDSAGHELVSYVPVKAQAGYMRGYADPHFIEKLPAFSLPGLIKDGGTYRMFEVSGESMLQLGGKGLVSGDTVIGRYLEDIFALHDNRVYVVVSTEGVSIKRVFNRLKDKESPSLLMTSDNKNGNYPNYLLKPNQILEVWEVKRRITSDLSFDTDLYKILGELQFEQARLKQKVDKFNKGE